MKNKILRTLLLIPIISIGTLGLVSCSGSTIQPPVEPPVEPPIVIPPTPIYKMVKLLIPPIGYNESYWEWFKVEEVEHVKYLKDVYTPTLPHNKVDSYIIKIKGRPEVYAKVWGEIAIQYKQSYNNWLKVSNERNNK